jgi:hypothetical protein
MKVSALIPRFRTWLARQFKKSDDSPAFTADDLRIARRNQFCMAIPFPSLIWSERATEANLVKLHDYAVQLANSGLDWYFEKKRGKKAYARVMHFFTYLFGIAAAIVPLVMIVGSEFEIFSGRFSNPRGFAAETALVLIGIAGGFNLVDRSAGFSADCTRLNRALIEFQFDWNALSRLPKQKGDNPQRSEGANKPRRNRKETNPDVLRINRVKEFCLAILDITSGETDVWAIELRERVAQMVRNLPQPSRPH